MYTEDRSIIETQSYLKELFDYHLEGYLVWKSRSVEFYIDERHKKIVENRSIGKRAGTIKKTYKKGEKSYYIVNIHKQSCRCSRLIWIWHYGEIPAGMEIDHEDRDGLNDRIENLRLATSSQNKLNRNVFKSNTTGERNIREKGDKFQVSLIREFTTLDEAIKWRDFNRKQDAEWLP